jgi:phosphatidylserine/phosphatidylglycerophosphate/cardiolipin synthase-like enzyme
MRRITVTARLIFGAALLGAGVPAIAQAGAYPWVPLGDDVRVIPDPRVEMNLRLALVRRAQKTIDIANYDGRFDRAVAMPLATALREAADRGVRVRYVVSWNSVVLFDYFHKFGKLLTDPPTRVPIAYLEVGGPVAQDQGWGLLDGVHEKLLIVDGRMLMTTGRGIGDQYLWWLDTAFALRGPLVAQAADTFERVWREARRYHVPYTGYLGGPRRKTAPVFEETALTALDPDQRRRLDEVVAWLGTPATAAAQPGVHGRMLHFDFLRQLRDIDRTPADVDVEERLDRLSDPVVQALIARLAGARSVRIATVSSILHPAVKQALLDARQRGADITVFTNTAAPRLDVSRAPIVSGGSVWSLSLDDLDDLLAAGVRVLSFQIREGTPWVFLHRKLAIIDDTVVCGSHNFNVPSTVFFDEASFEVTHPGLADELTRLFDADARANGEPLDPAYVHSERVRTRTRILRWLSLPALGFM